MLLRVYTKESAWVSMSAKSLYIKFNLIPMNGTRKSKGLDVLRVRGMGFLETRSQRLVLFSSLFPIYRFLAACTLMVVIQTICSKGLMYQLLFFKTEIPLGSVSFLKMSSRPYK